MHPALDLWHPELKEHFKTFTPIKCAEERDWVYVRNGTFRISQTAREQHGIITCDYIPLVRGTYVRIQSRVQNHLEKSSTSFLCECSQYKIGINVMAGGVASTRSSETLIFPEWLLA